VHFGVFVGSAYQCKIYASPIRFGFDLRAHGREDAPEMARDAGEWPTAAQRRMNGLALDLDDSGWNSGAGSWKRQVIVTKVVTKVPFFAARVVPA
jgi:hypothetical protein